MCFLSAHDHNFSPTLQGTKGTPLVQPNKRSREKEDSAIEEEPKRKKVKFADRQEPQGGRKESKEDRLEEFTRIMSKKRSKKADWAADVEVEGDDPNLINKPKKQSEAKNQKLLRANSADSDDSSMRDNAEETISDTEWMRRKMGGTELYEQVFEQSDDKDEPTKPKTTQVYPRHAFQYHYFILKLY